MTKADLVEEVSRVVEISRRVGAAVVETVFESILQAMLDGSKVAVSSAEANRQRVRGARALEQTSSGHSDLRSCAGGGDISGEALTEAPIGGLSSREIALFGHEPRERIGKTVARPE